MRVIRRYCSPRISWRDWHTKCSTLRANSCYQRSTKTEEDNILLCEAWWIRYDQYSWWSNYVGRTGEISSQDETREWKKIYWETFIVIYQSLDSTSHSQARLAGMTGKLFIFPHHRLKSFGNLWYIDDYGDNTSEENNLAPSVQENRSNSKEER